MAIKRRGTARRATIRRWQRIFNGHSEQRKRQRERPGAGTAPPAGKAEPGGVGWVRGTRNPHPRLPPCPQILLCYRMEGNSPLRDGHGHSIAASHPLGLNVAPPPAPPSYICPPSPYIRVPHPHVCHPPLGAAGNVTSYCPAPRLMEGA